LKEGLLSGRILVEKILEWLREDAPYGDATTRALGLQGVCAQLVIRAKTGGVAACSSELAEALRSLGLTIDHVVESGKEFSEGDIVMAIRGPAEDLLLLERTLLNALAYFSGVASATRRLVNQARQVNPGIKVAATRKTPPGLRLCAKIAFEQGGGDTHRWGLSDAIIVKDSHVELVGDLERAIRSVLKRKSFVQRVEVEVSKPEDAVLAARLGVDIVMLDNMSPEEVREALRLLEEAGLRSRVIVEASGGIGPWNIATYAATGVDVISTSYPFYHPDRVDLSAEMRRIEC
jgi:nicotinate-nucleotide pyrophosphorylase (carboxylating)